MSFGEPNHAVKGIDEHMQVAYLRGQDGVQILRVHAANVHSCASLHGLGEAATCVLQCLLQADDSSIV